MYDIVQYILKFSLPFIVRLKHDLCPVQKNDVYFEKRSFKKVLTSVQGHWVINWWKYPYIHLVNHSIILCSPTKNERYVYNLVFNEKKCFISHDSKPCLQFSMLSDSFLILGAYLNGPDNIKIDITKLVQQVYTEHHVFFKYITWFDLLLFTNIFETVQEFDPKDLFIEILYDETYNIVIRNVTEYI
jgi:hypothetical protein